MLGDVGFEGDGVVGGVGKGDGGLIDGAAVDGGEGSFDEVVGVERDGDVDASDVVTGAQVVGLGGLAVEGVAAIDAERAGSADTAEDGHHAAVPVVLGIDVGGVGDGGNAVGSGLETGDAEVALIVSVLALVGEDHLRHGSGHKGFSLLDAARGLDADVLDVERDLCGGCAVGIEDMAAERGAALEGDVIALGFTAYDGYGAIAEKDRAHGCG